MKKHAPVFLLFFALPAFCAEAPQTENKKESPAQQRTLPVLNDSVFTPPKDREDASTFNLIDNSNIKGVLAPAGSAPAPAKPAQSVPPAQTAQPKPAEKTETPPQAVQPALPPAPPKTAAPSPQPKAVKKDYSKPGASWIKSYTSNFNIFTDKNGFGMTTPNIGMTFESAYADMRMNMPEPMPDKTNIYIYKTREDYLGGEFGPYQWSEAVFFPAESTIVMYNATGDKDGLKRDFMHEYTHMVNAGYMQNLPLWLDEGMAVNMEDISKNPDGGDWAKDLIKKDLRPYKNINKKFQKSAGGPVLYFIKFGDFMDDKSLAAFSSSGKVENWYLQAYAMVRFLWKPYNSPSPENQIKFRKFMDLIKNGETVYDKNGKKTAKKYTVEEALKKAYTFGSADDFENKFWQWYGDLKKRYDGNPADKQKKGMYI